MIKSNAEVKTVEVSIPYEPRPLQREIHKAIYNHGNRIRFVCLAIHRRFGKTVFAVNECVAVLTLCPHPKPRVFYIAPTFKQAKSIAWEYVKEFTRVIPGIKYLETDLVAIFPNGGRLQLLGGENFESIRGNYVDLAVLDEFGNMNPQIWREVLRPAMADRLGSCIFLGTPNGRNHFYDIYMEALHTEGWLARTYSATETGLIPEEELLNSRRTMGEEEYRQEFLCDWQAAVRGSYYALECKRVRDTGRLCVVPHAEILPVDVSFDLGMDDATALWFVQCVGREIRLIDYVEFTNTSLQEILVRLSRYPYVFGEAILPHDAQVRELSTGRTRVDTVNDSNLFQTVSVVTKMKVEDGINAVRQIIGRCYFNAATCAKGFDCLENYRKKYDAKTGQYLKMPVHDKYSHGADSFRYLATHYSDFMGNIAERKIEQVRVVPPRNRLYHHSVLRNANVWGGKR